ncbi:MAG: IPT/TIG domain-containing protein [Isosphaeraceae bacterium]
MRIDSTRSKLRAGIGRKSAYRRQSSRYPLEALEERVVLSLLGQQLFPSDNPWNQNIASAPVAANSTAIIQNIISSYGNGALHPDFGQDTQGNNPLYGIPYNVVHGNSQPKVSVVIDGYPSESDIEPAPIPANPVIEGDMQNGPTVGLDNRGDSHLIVYDVDNNIDYEFYGASRPSENADGMWHAEQETVWNMNTDEFRTLGWTSADAAGLPILPGLLRPDEALPQSEGGQGAIDHAIRFTLQNSVILDQFLYPASHTANPGNTSAALQPPMGARFRLKANVDISSLDPESKVIAQAMKDYGLILADNGSNFYISGASESVNASNQQTLTWNDNDIQDSVHGLKSLPFSDFEVVDSTPVVTGLSQASGPAGSTVTVVGQNFTGAAGHLQVLFGTTAGTNVTVLDDSHVSAVVPAGSGTVDVRVLSGVDSGADSSNYTSPIFGYGISAATTADRFTYGPGSVNPPPSPQPGPSPAPPVNTPPTVVAPAKSSANPVTGTSTQITVLGSDAAGESTLTYTWAVTAAPTGGTPVFSVNGTNAAKQTTVRFNRAGQYAFQVTILGPGGLSVTSQVALTVKPILTSITISPSTVTLKNGARQQFAATALDQFGNRLSSQPAFHWSIAHGGGRISAKGLFTVPPRGTGKAVVQARAGHVLGHASITVSLLRTAKRR